MSRTHTGSSKFEFKVGDIVQFNTTYGWGVEATEGINYKIIDNCDHWKSSISKESKVNGFNKEIMLDCVEDNWQDFMLMTRPAAPLVVNVTVNNDGNESSDDFADALGAMLREKVLSHRGGFFDNRISDMCLVGESEQVRCEWPGQRYNGTLNFGAFGSIPDCEIGDNEEDEVVELASDLTAPVKSDGGSSSYYDLPLSDKLMQDLFDRWEAGKAHIRTEELIREIFGNDFDFGTAFKSLVRARGASLGAGKEGNDIVYETNKVQYYAKKIGEVHGKD